MLLPAFSLINKGFCQIPTGAWRDHLPYGHAKKLAEYENRIFCATYDGSLFSYDLGDKSLKKYSKVNGLSDADISTIGVSSETGFFFIGYTNGNIDLIRNDSIINVSDIKRKSIMGDKSINNIYMLGSNAYLACGFGIVVLDLSRKEIKDTYYFGPGGTQIFVNDITSNGTDLYAATEKGIFRASLSDPNLLDFNAWEHIQNLPDPDAKYDFVVWYNNRMVTIYGTSENENVITFDNQQWSAWDKSSADHYEYIGEQNGFLKLSTYETTKIFDSQENLIRDEVTSFARYVLLDSRNRLWFAAWFGGLGMVDEGLGIVPEGPPNRDAGDIEAMDGHVWVGGGTYNSQWSGYGAYSFIDEKWKEFSGNTIPILKNFLNISEISIDPLDHNHIIGGSYGFGIAEFQDGALVGVEDETGGVLKPVTQYENQPGYVRITGTDINKEGTAYALGSNSETALYKKVRGGSWTAIELDYEGFDFAVNTGELLAASNGQLWISLLGKGILVVTEENGTSTNERMITVKNQEGDLFENILSLAEDKEGSIWVGTTKGPVIFYDPSNLFQEDKVIGYQPAIPRNDGTNFASLLLASEQINDIEVDGANQKWLATEKSGVFLVSPDGKKEIHHFTAENSPLFSNSVRTVSANDKTGEVFFGTEKGIIAFRAGATEGGDDFGDVYVFPNPVRENYEGDITITGLASNVNVKVTDIAGNLVYETTALGGQAIWNGRNFKGDRVYTGVYLVFCTNDDGSKTFVTKLLFIH
jgi:hypothetical protein